MRRRSVDFSVRTLFFIFLIGSNVFSRADAPGPEYLFPPFVQSGSVSAVAITGKAGEGRPGVWVDAPGIDFVVDTNKVGAFQVHVPAGFAAGPHLVRIFNEQGVSKPVYLVVTADPQLNETEPNDEFGSPQKIEKLPVGISGRLQKRGDVDCYSVHLEKGETLMAQMEAYVMAAAIDGALRLVASDGHELAFNHDDGRTLDPRLVWTAPEAGDFVLQAYGFPYPSVSDVQLGGGGASCFYHLSLSKSSRASEEWADTAQTGGLAAPFQVTGRISKPGELDRFLFDGKKGDRLRVAVKSASLGFPMDPWFRLEDKSGKEITRVDDSGGADPVLEWQVPDNGSYAVVVGNLLHRGGPRYCYRLEVEVPSPALKAIAPEHSFSIEAGKTNSVKISLQRQFGFSAKTRASMRGAPAGIHCAEVDVAENAADATITWTADAAARAFSGPIQFVFTDPKSGQEFRARNEFITTGENNGVPFGYKRLLIEDTDQLWLTVREAKPK